MAIRKISSRSLGDTAVATADIADGSVTSSKLAANLDIAGTLDVAGATTLDSGLTVDTSTLVVDATNNRVGIGEANPTHLLELQLPAATNGPMIKMARSAGAYNMFIGVTSDSDMAIYDNTETERLRFMNQGGISFDAGSNYLDDYEEGTFSMQLSDSNSGSDTLTMKYAKIGRLVACEGPFRNSEGNTSESYFLLSSIVNSNLTISCTLPFVPTDSGATTAHSHRNLELRSDGSVPSSGWMPVLAWPAGSATTVLTDNDRESSYYAAQAGNTLRKADNRTNVNLSFNFVYFTAT